MLCDGMDVGDDTVDVVAGSVCVLGCSEKDSQMEFVSNTSSSAERTEHRVCIVAVILIVSKARAAGQLYFVLLDGAAATRQPSKMSNKQQGMFAFSKISVVTSKQKTQNSVSCHFNYW